MGPNIDFCSDYSVTVLLLFLSGRMALDSWVHLRIRHDASTHIRLSRKTALYCLEYLMVILQAIGKTTEGWITVAVFAVNALIG